MSKIEIHMIYQFNEMLQERESALRLTKSDQSRDVYYIQLKEDEFISKNALIQPNDEFYEMFENYFRSYGIEKISYNNTRTAFWAY